MPKFNQSNVDHVHLDWTYEGTSIYCFCVKILIIYFNKLAMLDETVFKVIFQLMFDAMLIVWLYNKLGKSLHHIK